MLTAAQRLRRSNDFAAAVRGGRRAGRGGVVVHLQLPEGQPSDPTGSRSRSSEPVRDSTGAGIEPVPARAGFVVSKAVGGAVVRNVVRRRLRHLVRDRMAGLPAGSTLVVRALPAAADLPYARLAADLDAAIAAALSSRRTARRSR